MGYTGWNAKAKRQVMIVDEWVGVGNAAMFLASLRNINLQVATSRDSLRRVVNEFRASARVIVGKHQRFPDNQFYHLGTHPWVTFITVFQSIINGRCGPAERTFRILLTEIHKAIMSGAGGHRRASFEAKYQLTWTPTGND